MVLAITVFQHTQKDFENVSTEAEGDSAGLHSPETSAILLRSSSYALRGTHPPRRAERLVWLSGMFHQDGR